MFQTLSDVGVTSTLFCFLHRTPRRTLKEWVKVNAPSPSDCNHMLGVCKTTAVRWIQDALSFCTTNDQMAGRHAPARNINMHTLLLMSDSVC